MKEERVTNYSYVEFACVTLITILFMIFLVFNYLLYRKEFLQRHEEDDEAKNRLQELQYVVIFDCSKHCLFLYVNEKYFAIIGFHKGLLRFTIAIFAAIFSFYIIDVNEWINNEYAECMLPHLNICDWFTRSHSSKGENRTRNRSTSCKCKRVLRWLPTILAKN